MWLLPTTNEMMYEPWARF